MSSIRTNEVEKASAEAFLELSSNNSVKVNLGDAAGGNTFQVDNTAPASVFSVDSNGDAEVLGDLTVGGDLIVNGIRKQIISIYAEENSGLSDNSDEWSFGANDAGDDRAIFLRYPGRILAVGFAAEAAGSGTTVIELRIEDASGLLLTSASVTKLSGNKRASNNIILPIDFAGGAYARFRTVLAGSAGGAVVSALIELDVS